MAKKAKTTRVTLHDVAAAAGVSTMTVSNALLGRLGRVSPKTKARIEKYVARLGYRPHSGARGLRNAAWHSIGLLVVDDSPKFLANSFISNLVAGLSNHLTEQNHSLQVQGIQMSRLGDALVFKDIRTDGICSTLFGTDHHRRMQTNALLALRQPILLFQETLSFPGKDVCVVRLDNRAGGRMLAEEVLRAGARRVVMLVPQAVAPGIAQRVEGAREVVEARGKSASMRMLFTPSLEFDQVQRALAEYLDKNSVPDAILAANDDVGIAVLKLLQSKGLKVPRDILVTGFNAFDSWQYSDPVLTSIRSPAYEMGARGAHEMMERLRTGSFSQKTIVMPVELVRGGST